MPAFGSAAPYAEPLWYSRETTPYYNESHKRLRAFVRDFVEKELKPNAEEWEKSGIVPQSAVQKYVEAGFAIVHPPKPEYMGGMSLPAGIKPEEWDTFHTIIVNDEMNRIGYSGVLWGLNAGNGIGCPPVMNFAREELRREFMPKVARGEVKFCLGITEPDAGSDVAGIRTTAKREGDHYVINGAKKWITNAIWADYVTAAVRTGGPGRGGISLVIIPLTAPGVTRRKIDNSGVTSSGSTYIEFDDVKVPVGNLVGQENKGFSYIMSNFNPERLWLAGSSIRLARICCEDAFIHACTRETFGKPLIESPIIRAKFSKMGQLIEPCQAFMEQLAYAIDQAKKQGKTANIGGQTALLKVMSTRCLEKVCREAQQVMGGLGYSKTGKGARIEQISRDVRVYVVGGGSEEIMSDLAIREEMKEAMQRRDSSRL